MNVFHYWQKVLFKSFSVSFRAASRPTYQSIPFEAALKSAKKSFKNHIFRIVSRVQLFCHSGASEAKPDQNEVLRIWRNSGIDS